MSRIKILGLALAALFAFTAVATATASAAPVWKVGGVALKAGEKVNLKENVTVKKSFVLKKANGLTITCPTLKAKNAFIEGLNKNGAESLTFSGCTVSSNETTCEVEKGEVKTVAVKSELLEAGGNIKIKFTPKEGTTFATITIKSKTGKTCLQAGSPKVTGSATGEANSKTEAEEELVAHTVKFTSTSGSELVFGEEAAELTGEASLELASGAKYSASGSYLTVEPKPVKFAGGGKSAQITIRNWSAEALTIGDNASAGFTSAGLCNHHVLTTSCVETVECVTTGNLGTFKAYTESGPLYWDEAELRC
jgi:hypothetical protein